jgi:NAD(P)-dependent dehydrogenase (short-subunit alcohol dehydrogenase family)
MELADYNIRVNAAPAVVNTTLYHGVFAESSRKGTLVDGFHPGKIGSADEVANAVILIIG